MNKHLKKFNAIALTCTIALSSSALIINKPTDIYAYVNESGKEFKLTEKTLSTSLQNKLNEKYAGTDKKVNVDYSTDVLTKLTELDTKVIELEARPIEEVSADELKTLFTEFAKISESFKDDDIQKHIDNDLFDSIFYRLYKYTQGFTDLDTRAEVLTNACKDINTYGVKALAAFYFDYTDDIYSYNTMIELKYTFMYLNERRSMVYDQILRYGIVPGGSAGEDEDVEDFTDYEALYDFLETSNTHQYVGTTDDDFDIPDSGTDIPDDSEFDEAINDESSDTQVDDNQSIWDSIKDFVNTVVNTFTNLFTDSVNSNVTYVTYENSNGCKKITKEVDKNSKIVSRTEQTVTNSQELKYCEAISLNSGKYPEAPNLSKYSLMSDADFDKGAKYIAYSLNKTLDNPQYYKTEVEIKDNVISYDEAVELLKQIVVKANGSFAQDSNSTMFSLEGKIFIIDDSMTFNKEFFDNLSNKFQYIFVGFISVNEEKEAEEISGATNTLDITVKNLKVNDKEIASANVYVKNEQFMLPVQKVFQELGAEVTIDDDNNATISFDGNIYHIEKGSLYITSNSKTHTLLNKNELSNKKLFSDLYSVLISHGYKYIYDADTQTLSINK